MTDSRYVVGNINVVGRVEGGGEMSITRENTERNVRAGAGVGCIGTYY